MNQAMDDNFFNRADEHIHLSNDQLKSESPGKVSASMMYSVARFNSWLSARGWKSGEEMKAARQETIDYFVAAYKEMLEENLDDYIHNFNDYMRVEK